MHGKLKLTYLLIKAISVSTSLVGGTSTTRYSSFDGSALSKKRYSKNSINRKKYPQDLM